MSRKDYWNDQYLEYWKKRVCEADDTENNVSEINPGDVKTGGEKVLKYLLNELIEEEYCDKRILDVGCGFCRIYPLLSHTGIDYWGIDISEAMIERSKSMYPELSGRIQTAEIEDLTGWDSKFDYIICFGVFDACYQNKALSSMLRMLKMKGKLLLTGKNDYYYFDDERALIAEVNARAKGHPNFFTNYRKMVKQLDNQGHNIVKQWLFERRGDFSHFNFVNEQASHFYEYATIIQRGVGSIDFKPFSSVKSKAYLQMEEENG